MPYVVTLLTPRSTARSANGTALENFERRTTPDYDVVSSRACLTYGDLRESLAHCELLGSCHPTRESKASEVREWLDSLQALNGGERALIDRRNGDRLEVKRTSAYAILQRIQPAERRPRMSDGDGPDHLRRIIDAYNAAQTTTTGEDTNR